MVGVSPATISRMLKRIPKYSTEAMFKVANAMEYYTKNKTSDNFQTFAVHKDILKWTLTSIDCYKIGKNCHVCEIPKMISEPCRLIETLDLIIQLHGKPTQEIIDKLRGSYDTERK